MPMTSAKFIYHLLEKNGVFIVDGSKSNLPICLDKQSSILYGMWNSEHNVMLLCTQNGDNKQIARTFAHEAVHLVQDCRAGFHNKYLQEAHKGTERFLDYLKGATPFNFHAMTTLYGKDQILLEAEARYFSDSIHKTSSVVTLLEAYCGFKF